MKKNPKVPDPLGERPMPKTGDSKPRFQDDTLRRRSAAALASCEAVWVGHDPQEAIIAQIRAYLESWALAEDRSTCGGRRLSQYSQAGKSATMKRLKRVLAEVAAASGLTPNEYKVVIVTLRKRTTLNQLYRLVLEKMGDLHWDQKDVSSTTLLRRLKEHTAMVGMELVIVDEVQHLDNETKDAVDVIDQLKVFLDEAYFPIVFVGDEDSIGFFERNPKFATRLGDPLRLPPMRPLDDDDDGLAFRLFCREFDRALVKEKALGRRAGLADDELLNGLLVASGGHVGRVARLLQVAVPRAVWRGAATVDAYDLSHAVRTFALSKGWCDHDPYSEKV